VTGNDEYATATGAKLSVPKAAGLLANDSDPNNDTMKAVLVSKSPDGTVKLKADGSFTFTPKSGFVGTTSFTYKVSDGKASSAVTTVTIDVLAPDSAAPLVDTSIVARNESYTTAKNGVLSVDAAAGVLANDVDKDGDPLTAVLVSGPKAGTLTLADDGSFVYTPDGVTTGKVGFTYRVSDGDGLSALATATIAISKSTTAANGVADANDRGHAGSSHAALTELMLGDGNHHQGSADGDGLDAVAWALDGLFNGWHHDGIFQEVYDDALPAPTGLPDYLNTFYSEFALF
jgi:hypothetical protein